MSNTFVTPKAVTTIAQSRINYNDSITSLLDNFASTGSPGPTSISVEGTNGLRTGMLWYKSGTDTTQGQGRLLIYNGSEFTRNGIASYKTPSIAAANSAVLAGEIAYGELVVVGTDTLYIVNSSNTGVIPLSVGTATNSDLLDGLDSTQFLRSDQASSISGKLTVSSNLSVSQNIGVGISNPVNPLELHKSNVVVRMNDTNGAIEGSVDSYIIFQATGTTHGELGFVNTLSGDLNLNNRQGNVVIASDTNNLHSSSKTSFTVDGVEKAFISSEGANVISSLSVVGQSTFSSAAVEDLTQFRVLLAGSGGELSDSGNLLFANSNLSVTGNVYASGDITTASDARLKDNVVSISGALDTVKQLRGVSFTKKDSNKNSIGLIAQEVESILPDLVGTDGEFKSVAYQNIVALLIEAIKEQQQQIESLQRGQ